MYLPIYVYIADLFGQDMSYKYAAAIQGICNTGSNITYYALSANIMCATPPMAGAC